MVHGTCRKCTIYCRNISAGFAIFADTLYDWFMCFLCILLYRLPFLRLRLFMFCTLYRSMHHPKNGLGLSSFLHSMLPSIPWCCPLLVFPFPFHFRSDVPYAYCMLFGQGKGDQQRHTNYILCVLPNDSENPLIGTRSWFWLLEQPLSNHTLLLCWVTRNEIGTWDLTQVKWNTKDGNNNDDRTKEE